ncbi:hypothetical protein BDN67DRAFT_966197 [Paxillus ammoniavirescens]|nr:hypothetical protein BDN67DRAFT_966197 [Paxillus ammoniavirescens]
MTLGLNNGCIDLNLPFRDFLKPKRELVGARLGAKFGSQGNFTSLTTQNDRPIR